MRRFSGRSVVAALALASAACGPKKPAAEPADPTAGMTRGEIEMELRQRLGTVDGDACAKQAWLKKLIPKVRGLQFEVAEELLAEQSQGCRGASGTAVAEGGGAKPAGADKPAGAGEVDPFADAIDPRAKEVAEAKAAEAKAAETKAAEAKAGDPKAGDPKPADPKPADAKPGDAKPGDAKPGAPAKAAGDGKAAPADRVAEAPAPPAPTESGACSRKRAEATLRAKAPGRTLNRANIDAEFQRCFNARIAACQTALDADVDEGLTCWKQDPWPEVPAGVAPDAISATAMCLLELKAVVADLRKCRTKKPAERDACVHPYVGFSPQCSLLKADRMWNAFPGREDVERVAKADAAKRAEREAKEAKLKADAEAKAAKLKAEQDAKEAKLKAEQEAKRAAEEARIAKETERCFGRTTLEFAEKLRDQPGPRTVPGCKYQVSGRVVSRNNVFVQLVDTSGRVIFLLRTREPFNENDVVTDRTATFDSIEDAEMADGSKRAFAVFALEPAPKPKK